jgi:hypothetical protein
MPDKGKLQKAAVESGLPFARLILLATTKR